MRKTRKIMALLLSAVMLFAFPVSAMAEDGDTYVDGFWNADEQYCLRIGNFGLVVLTDYITKQAPNDDTWIIRLRCRVGDSVVFNCALNSTLEATVIPSSIDYEDWDFSENAPLGARIYINDSSLNDTGIVIFFDKNSDYLTELADCTSVSIQCEIENADSSIYLTVGELYVWYTMSADLKGLEEYKASNETVEDEYTSEETYEQVETIENQPETEEPVVEETTEEAPITNESTEEQPIINETTEEPVINETTEDEPVAEETIEDRPADDTPAVDTEAPTDTDKGGSPDTGANGIAATAALSIVALGAVMLSRKNR